MRRLRWVADGGASEAEPRALHGAERLVVVRGEAELLGVGPRLDVFPRLCEIKMLRRVRAEFRAPDTLIVFHTVPRATRAAPGVELRAEQIFCPLDDEDVLRRRADDAPRRAWRRWRRVVVVVVVLEKHRPRRVRRLEGGVHGRRVGGGGAVVLLVVARRVTARRRQRALLPGRRRRARVLGLTARPSSRRAFHRARGLRRVSFLTRHPLSRFWES